MNANPRNCRDLVKDFFFGGPDLFEVGVTIIIM